MTSKLNNTVTKIDQTINASGVVNEAQLILENGRVLSVQAPSEIRQSEGIIDIIKKLWASFLSLFKQVSLGNLGQEKYSDEWKSIANYKCLGPSSISLFENYFKKHSVTLRTEGLCGSIVNTKKNYEANIVALPLVIKGTGLFARDHIVSVVVNKADRCLEFYDSKGRTILDHANDSLIEDLQGNKTSFIDAIKKICKVYDIVLVKENTFKHQIDSYNCGPEVLYDMIQAKNGKSAEDRYYKEIKDSDSLRGELIQIAQNNSDSF
jgi:hypothetical protein